MLRLTPIECRVLGVLVEKAYTTPAQYPLTLNAITTGANQKNNRDPVTSLDEDEVIRALDGLRAKDLVREVMMTGSRVAKFRQVARETLSLSPSELVVLTELLLRGPQTEGELRGRASRMTPLESTEAVQAILESMMSRDEPLVERFPPEPGSRAPRYAQRLCPGLHRIAAAAPALPSPAAPHAPAPHAPAPDHSAGDLSRRVERLESAVRELTRRLDAVTGAAAGRAD
jgi:hypothetical protein